MARNQRWYQVQGSFRAGVLSPAAQDQVDKEEYREGAARLENFLVRRDGGIVGRPGFVRQEGGRSVPTPRYGLLAGQRWSSQLPDADVTDLSRDRAPKTGRFGSDLYEGQGGIAPLERIFTIRGGDTRVDVLNVELAAARPRFITLHGVQLAQGSWQAEFTDSEGEEQTELTLGAFIERSNIFISLLGKDSNDPFDLGQFAPGRVPRDITIPLVVDGSPQQNTRDVPSFSIRAVSTRATYPLRLVVRGVSCFATEAPPPYPGGRAPVDLRGRNVFGRLGAPYRLLPWVVENEAYLVALSMQWVAYYERPEGGLPVLRQGGDILWSFTEKQLRELTWTARGTSLLLFHHDFPHPLELRFPVGTTPELSIGYLDLVNLPPAPQDVIDQSAIGTVVEGVLLGNRITGLTATTLDNGTTLRISWTPTGAPRYRVLWEAGNAAPSSPEDPTRWDGNRASNTSTYDITGLTSGREYFVAVSALPQAGLPADLDAAIDQVNTGESDLVSLTTTVKFPRPADPRNLSGQARDTAAGALRWTWDAVANATDYELQWKLPTTDWTTIGTQRGTTLDIVGTMGLIYQLRVRARRGSTEANRALSDWVVSSTVRAQVATPGAPANVRIAVSTGADGRIAMSWTPGANAQRTLIEYGRQIPTGWTPWTAVTSTSNARSFDLVAGETYRFRARSQRTNADDSAIVVSTPDRLQARNRPQGNVPGISLATSTTQGGRILTSWAAIPRTDRYEVQYRIQGNAASVQTITTSGTARSFNLNGGVRYEFRVRSTREFADPGRWTAWRAITALYAAPAVPSGLSTADGSGDGQIRLSWNAVSGATSYQLQRQTGTGSFGNTVTVTGTSTTLTLTVGTTYTFRVKARRTGSIGDSGWSSTVRHTAMYGPLVAPGNPRITRIFGGSTSATAAWDSVPGATGYELDTGGGGSQDDARQRATDGGSLITVTRSPTDWSRRTPTHWWAFRVRALRGSEQGPWSEVVLRRNV